MPTASGAETIGERLTRLRADLARVRATIQRAESNGQSNMMGGASVTEIAYERAQMRQRELTAEIASLEARLSGSAARPGMALTVTRIDD
jgi:hypothetical protein